MGPHIPAVDTRVAPDGVVKEGGVRFCQIISSNTYLKQDKLGGYLHNYMNKNIRTTLETIKYKNFQS